MVVFVCLGVAQPTIVAAVMQLCSPDTVSEMQCPPQEMNSEEDCCLLSSSTEFLSTPMPAPDIKVRPVKLGSDSVSPVRHTESARSNSHFAAAFTIPLHLSTAPLLL